MTWEGIDQRKFPRARHKCLIRVLKDGRKKAIGAFTENLGAGGICVVLEKGFGLFENVSLQIFLREDEKPIFCNGTVVWVVRRHPTNQSETVKYDTGIEFWNMSEEDKGRISRLVQDILNSDT